MISRFGIIITGRDIKTLQAETWINDNIINFYMKLIVERKSILQDIGLPSVYAFDTQFMNVLNARGHSGLARWTRNVDLFATEIVLVPVHRNGNHWGLYIMDMCKHTITYYDSLGASDNGDLNRLLNYLKDECFARKGGFEMEIEHWKLTDADNIPRQNTTFDCGVFVCLYAHFYTMRQEFNFNQNDIEFHRKKMVSDIIGGKIL